MSSQNKVLILMSTFNGGTKIIRQVKSILLQEKVDVNILIRDDGSKKATLRIIESLSKSYPKKIKVIEGQNHGWRKSFQELLYLNYYSKYDYYGFSDQDDIWKSDKLISCINLMKKDKWQGPKLAHCAAVTVDKNLKPTTEQEKRVACPPTHKAAVATEYFQGCGMIWNEKCMQLIRHYHLKNANLAHDYWVGLLGYFFGRVYFCNKPEFYHVRYDDNQSSDGNINKGRVRRFISLLRGKKAYMNPANDLLKGYSEYLLPKDIIFLRKLVDYKKNFKDKISLIFDMEFCRPTIAATIFMKLSLLMNLY